MSDAVTVFKFDQQGKSSSYGGLLLLTSAVKPSDKNPIGQIDYIVKLISSNDGKEMLSFKGVAVDDIMSFGGVDLLTFLEEIAIDGVLPTENDVNAAHLYPVVTIVTHHFGKLILRVELKGEIFYIFTDKEANYGQIGVSLNDDFIKLILNPFSRTPTILVQETCIVVSDPVNSTTNPETTYVIPFKEKLYSSYQANLLYHGTFDNPKNSSVSYTDTSFGLKDRIHPSWSFSTNPTIVKERKIDSSFSYFESEDKRLMFVTEHDKPGAIAAAVRNRIKSGFTPDIMKDELLKVYNEKIVTGLLTQLDYPNDYFGNRLFYICISFDKSLEIIKTEYQRIMNIS